MINVLEWRQFRLFGRIFVCETTSILGPECEVFQILLNN